MYYGILLHRIGNLKTVRYVGSLLVLSEDYFICLGIETEEGAPDPGMGVYEPSFTGSVMLKFICILSNN